MDLSRAHLQVIHGTRRLMKHDIEGVQWLLDSARRQPRRTYRVTVAKLVLELLSWKVGRVLVPVGTLGEAAFCDHIAIAIAGLAENDRPMFFEKYSPERFSRVLIERYLTSYGEIDGLGFPDEELPKFTFALADIPSDPSAELRTYIRSIDVLAFGRYTLREGTTNLYQPESP